MAAHHSHHAHHVHDTLAEKNEKYWNTASQSVFKQQWVHDLQKQITDHLQANIDWIGIDQTKGGPGDAPRKVLDYACGNGVASRAVASYFSKFVGMDLSEGMLEKYKAAAHEQGLPEEQVHTVQGDLIVSGVDPSLKGEEMFNFDLVVICMALHHLEDPKISAKRLVERLKPGGVFLVIDWATSSEKYRQQQEQATSGVAIDHDHAPGIYAAAHTVAHSSFAREQMEEAFGDAGCTDFDFVLHETPSVVPNATGGQMQLFFGRGTVRM